LSRTYRTTAWFGPLLAVCTYVWSHSLPLAASYLVGVLLAVALLKSQEWLIGRLAATRQAGAYQGWDAGLPLGLLLPLKYLAIAALVGYGLHAGLLRPFAFAAGMITLQFVIVAKALGRMMTGQRMTLNDVYVRPHSKTLR